MEIISKLLNIFKNLWTLEMKNMNLLLKQRKRLKNISLKTRIIELEEKLMDVIDLSSRYTKRNLSS
jgi:hypothetical protein